MLGAGLGGYGGYDSPEGLADAHGMGYGDVDGGAWGGGNYSALARAAMDVWSKYYGGNSSLLGHNRSVFGGPMMTSGPTDAQGAMIGLNAPTDVNPGGYETVNFTPAASLASVDLTGGPPRNDYGFLANNANILGLGPNYNGIGISFPGGHPGSVGPMGLAEGGGEPYIRPRRLAYRNAYDQDDPSNFFGGM